MHQSIRKLLPLGAALLLAFSAAAKDVSLSGNFAKEHGTTSPPAGHVDATLTTTTHKLKYNIDCSGLSGPLTIAHFHGPAKPGVDAGVMAPIPGPYKTGMTATTTVDRTKQAAMLKAMTYVNLHTKACPKGKGLAPLMVSDSAWHGMRRIRGGRRAVQTAHAFPNLLGTRQRCCRSESSTGC